MNKKPAGMRHTDWIIVRIQKAAEKGGVGVLLSPDDVAELAGGLFQEDICISQGGPFPDPDINGAQ